MPLILKCKHSHATGKVGLKFCACVQEEEMETLLCVCQSEQETFNMWPLIAIHSYGINYWLSAAMCGGGGERSASGNLYHSINCGSQIPSRRQRRG